MHSYIREPFASKTKSIGTFTLSIMQKTSSMSKGRLVLSAGTLYGAISNLLEKGWISPCGETPDSEGRRKMYRITEQGEEILKAEYCRLLELVENGKNYINNV